MFYSKSTNGFYSTKVNGKNIPKDAVEITDEAYQSLMMAQSEGKIIVVDESGSPIAIVKEINIDEIRSAQWQKIQALRSKKKDGGVWVGGNWYHSDDASRIQQLGLKDRARDVLANGGLVTDPLEIGGGSVIWKTMAGDFVPMTVQLAFDIVDAIGVLDKAAFGAAEYHRAQMNASADPASYDFSGGWPVSFEAL